MAEEAIRIDVDNLKELLRSATEMQEAMNKAAANAREEIKIPAGMIKVAHNCGACSACAICGVTPGIPDAEIVFLACLTSLTLSRL